MGYNKCCIPGCSTKYGHDLILRIFPTDSILKAKWRQNLGNIRISQSSAVCELHFAQSEFEKIREDGKKKLKQNAVPSLSEEVRCHLSRLSHCIESDHSYNKLLPSLNTLFSLIGENLLLRRRIFKMNAEIESMQELSVSDHPHLQGAMHHPFKTRDTFRLQTRASHVYIFFLI